MSRILVIEDNAANMMLATEILKSAGYEVLQAEDADVGIQIARREHPALILMDIQLPGTDGLTATRMLRNFDDTRDVPIIAVTAHAMDGDEERILAAGCNGYLSKPIQMRALLNLVETELKEKT